jgi:hypothetical protein
MRSALAATIAATGTILLSADPAGAGVLSKAVKVLRKAGEYVAKEADTVVQTSLKSASKAVVAGKKEFYGLAKDALEKEGYTYYDGGILKGKTRGHARKPDYIAEKDDHIVIGETKAPAEPPTSSSWRRVRKTDSPEFSKVRREVAEREAAGQVSKEVGGHEIIIRGQLADYVKQIGKTYDLPAGAVGKKIRCAYTCPAEQLANVRAAMKNSGISKFECVDNGKGSITFIFDPVSL